jgi:hypothetical protein
MRLSYACPLEEVELFQLLIFYYLFFDQDLKIAMSYDLICRNGHWLIVDSYWTWKGLDYGLGYIANAAASSISLSHSSSS